MVQMTAEVAGFAERIKALGFHVYVAYRGSYGFITDDSESRVLSFQFSDGGSLGGNYGPASPTSGTGWRMDGAPWDLKTKENVKDALYAAIPIWVYRDEKKGTQLKVMTVAEYLKGYGSSSRFERV